jgi:hypothetical protein
VPPTGKKSSPYPYPSDRVPGGYRVPILELPSLHEVVVTSVKHFQPHTQECTCSPNFTNSICDNACCSQSQQSSIEQINVDSCDDLIDEENDLLKLEVQRLECERVKLKGKNLGQPT